MAGMCCEVVSGTGTTASGACDASSRAARRRRINLRRIRLVSGVEALAAPAEPMTKRQRLSCPSALIVGEDLVGSRHEQPSGSGSEAICSEILGRNPSPSKAGASEELPRYGMTMVCGRRREMEDAVSVRPNFIRGYPVHRSSHFYGVFDGHGCSHVAGLCQDRMHELVAEELETLESGAAPAAAPNWKTVMGSSFLRMDAEVESWYGRPRTDTCRCELRMPNCDHVGSTAVVAVVTPDQIIIGNCGDSRAVLCRGGVAVPLSRDHKPDRPDEMERIEAAGGRVIYWEGARVLGVLAMSRAIGDRYLKPYVIPDPEVTVTGRTEEDECLILASDGLWDVVTNETACGIARMCLRANGGEQNESSRSSSSDGDSGESRGRGNDKACSDAAMLLTKVALARHSTDNVSVLVVDLKRRS